MVVRSFETLVLQRLTLYPAVALLGPRQCGKTTLAKKIGGAYYDLEQESERLRLDLEWERRIAGEELVILDEAQEWPEIFPRLRGAIDQTHKKMGRFLILGSVSPNLSKQVSESLAGRLSLVELTPFLGSELEREESFDKLWLCGGYPDGGILDPGRFPLWQKDYLTLLAQRDLPNWGLSSKPATTERFLRMIAAVHGQIWNGSQIGQSLGVSYHTVNSYLDFLEGAFLTRRLRPYQSNLKKRLVKREKVYWRDSGLLHSLFNIQDQDTLIAQPWVGASWEGFVLEQILGTLASMGVALHPWYFRTSDGMEIDLILDFGAETWAIEIKLTTAPSHRDFERLIKASTLIGASKQFLISKSNQVLSEENRVSCNLPWLIRHLCETFNG